MVRRRPGRLGLPFSGARARRTTQIPPAQDAPSPPSPPESWWRIAAGRATQAARDVPPILDQPETRRRLSARIPGDGPIPGIGADYPTRTDDLSLTRRLLYQLS